MLTELLEKAGKLAVKMRTSEKCREAFQAFADGHITYNELSECMGELEDKQIPLLLKR